MKLHAKWWRFAEWLCDIYLYLYICTLNWYTVYNIYIYTYLAHQNPQICRYYFRQFFSSVIPFLTKNIFFQKYVFFFTRENPSFSHIWCHDISWSVPLDESNPFIDTSLGSITLSTLHVDYTFTPLALAGSSHKKGPDALGTCRTTLIMITINLELLEDVFPQ